MNSFAIEQKIINLKKKLNAIILAHYYQDPDIQDVADFIGDSLELSKKASSTNADIIFFCGVRFMAESARILNPNKKVIIPDINAGCSLEDSCKPEEFAKFLKQYPGHLVLTYINSSADVKAMSDIIVTSSNAEKIINSLPKDQKIIFAPDKYLGSYLAKKTNRDMVLWQGTCIVHENFSERELIKLKTKNSSAQIIAHPECPQHLLNYAEHIGSTSSLVNYVKENNGKEFIVLTEPNILHYMKLQSPNSIFYEVPAIGESGCSICSRCPYMALNTLEKLYISMQNLSPEIFIEESIAKKASISLTRMLELSYSLHCV